MLEAQPRPEARVEEPKVKQQLLGRSTVRQVIFHTSNRVARVLIKPIATIQVPPISLPSLDRGLIIATNHRSMLDAFVGLIVLHEWNVYPRVLVRADFCRMLIIGGVLKRLGAIPADRVGGGTEQASRELSAGAVLVIAPEGRITLPKERTKGIGNIKPGIGHIAIVHGTPVLLVALLNTDVCWPRGRLFPYIRFNRNERPDIRISTRIVDVATAASAESVVEQVRAGFTELLLASS